MQPLSLLLAGALTSTLATAAVGQQITAAGKPAQLDVRAAAEQSVRITLKPITFAAAFPATPAVVDRGAPAPVISLRAITAPVKKKVGALMVEVRPDPLTVVVTNAKGDLVQRLEFQPDGQLAFALDDSPVLGMGEGGPKTPVGANYRTLPIQFDRRGALDTMEPRWQSDAYGSRNPVATLVGTRGWGLFVATPWVAVDLRDKTRGLFTPWRPTAQDLAPQNVRNQQLANGKGLPPINQIVPGLYDVFVIDAHDPVKFMHDYSIITGPAVLPPKWALGYMQSHRTIVDETQILAVIDSFRSKRIPIDAVIYLGTGFSPRGWNTTQPSFTFNPDVFKRDPKQVIADMHAKNVKLVLHMIPPDRDKLPTLHGTIPAKPTDTLDASHIQTYWQQHVPLMNAGVDAFWPDEGDWFNLFERLTRHEMYYEGPLSTRPDVRPWSLHRNGYAGMAQWGGWVWSGDTQSSWKTLEGQIAVGLNYSLSIGPFWGSDIGGFYADSGLTAELYTRWFQFAAFCGSFRAHGRTWWTRLPWGWGLSDRGPIENNNTNSNPPTNPNDPRTVLMSEMNNPNIEPIARKYDELRYQLLPYTYTLAWQARTDGLPLMRALWLHYPEDVRARDRATEYLWGRDLLIAPVFQKGATSRDVYLPKGDWYDWWTNAKQTGAQTVTRAVDLATMPIFVRAGAIIPFDPVRQYTSQPVTEPTTLRVYRGANGDFTLYDDDGISQGYLKGRGSWTHLTWTDRDRQLTIAPGGPVGATNVVTPRVFNILVLPAGMTKQVTYTGKSLKITF